MSILTAPEDQATRFLSQQKLSSTRLIIKILRILHSSEQSKHLTHMLLKEDPDLVHIMNQVEESFSRYLEINAALAKLTEREIEILGILV